MLICARKLDFKVIDELLFNEFNSIYLSIDGKWWREGNRKYLIANG